MGYGRALQAAGAEVLSMEHFGDYQGTWIAHVEFEGAKAFVTGSYGSCSGCDSFQSEFDFEDHYHGRTFHGNGAVRDYGQCVSYFNLSEQYAEGCAKCEETRKKLADFGAHYLNARQTPEEIVAGFERELTADYLWDRDETQQRLDWVLAQIGAAERSVA